MPSPDPSVPSVPSAHPYRPYVVPYNVTPHLIKRDSSHPSARDLLADLDIPTDYLQNPVMGDMLSSLISRGLSKYAAIFIRQPFEIVKTTMQVQFLPNSLPEATVPTRRPRVLSDDVHSVRGAR
jgi:hypothetical protein